MTDFTDPKSRNDRNATDALSPDQRARVDELMSKIKSGSSGLNHHWGRGATPDDGMRVQSNESFSFTTNDEGVTVNGKHYENIDAVPAADRARIEALQSQIGPESDLMKQFLATGKPVSQRTTTRSWSTRKGSKTTTTHKTTTSTDDAAAQEDIERSPGATRSGFTTAVPDAHASPGAVPRSSGMRRLGQLVLFIGVIAIVWMGAQSLGLF